ncbi:Na+/H+ antiporter subunit A [Spiractinospora alimapuensis]|uniref:Na+/H+ antiporter subunit A n=1 Tax=Spiractinospora alimapuensis TaxID=2820884 RepID=UPI001F4451EE|nr:Na+/H+ antiporter subunit A [Spiractinospora alimapuensis]QVQ53543.1 Na+/H+ antiporter subunit A [Spiractinospora alimapuensis]
MLLATCALFGAAVFAGALVRRTGVTAFVLLALAPTAVLVWALTTASSAGGELAERHEWVPALGLSLDFRMDGLGLLMTVIITAIGALVLIYCSGYFTSKERGLGLLSGSLVAFSGAMLGLVLADDLILLYIFWELTTVFSYLLIGHKAEDRDSRRAALTAIVVTTLGGLAMLAGFIMIGITAGTYRISDVLANPPEGPFIGVALVLVLLGALSKSALVPLHFWLPGAMAAPTPISAYLHAAAMVKAGIYLVARFSPAFAPEVPWRAIVLTLGVATMIVGAYRALRQYDIKLLLAFSTVSQLGFLTVLMGAGTEKALLAGMVVLVSHALFKAALFLITGAIDHSTGTRDLRRLSGLRRTMPITFIAAILAAGSMAGIPPLVGFVGKEAAFEAFSGGGPVDTLVLVGLVVGSVLTMAYSVRYVWGAFFEWRGYTVPGGPAPLDHAPGWSLVWPPALLATVGLVIAPYVAIAHDLIPHIGLALMLSVVAILGGVGLFLIHDRVEKFQATVSISALNAEHGYRVFMAELGRVAGWAASITQRGSLPAYLGWILAVLLILPGTAVIMAFPGNGGLPEWELPVQVPLAILVAFAAFATVAARDRLGAVILAGVTGYGTAAAFALQGAPDVALTQVLAETILLLVFILVLRRLPDRFSENQPRLNRRIRAAVATAAGVLIVAVGYLALGARVHDPVSELYPAAVEEAGGYNIVNVTLVDLRAWDTMGEISVLLAVAAGVTSLIFVRRGNRPLPRVSDADSAAHVWGVRPRSGASTTRDGEGGAWLRGSATLAPERRSIVLEVLARIIFHPILLLSVYLLFAGHNDTGGGFAGGIVAGLALAVRYLAGGRYELGEAVPKAAGPLLGTGLTLATGSGIVSLLATGQVLRSGEVDWHLPIIGEVHISSVVVFDIGVYLLVIGLVVELLRALGAEVDRQIESARGPERMVSG